MVVVLSLGRDIRRLVRMCCCVSWGECLARTDGGGVVLGARHSPVGSGVLLRVVGECLAPTDDGGGERVEARHFRPWA